MWSHIAERLSAAQANSLQSTEGKRKPPVREMTVQVREEIVYRFVYAGQLTREISKNLAINDREAVERVIQRALMPRRPMPALIVPMRRAA